MSFVLRYLPDSDLGRRFRGTSGPYATHEAAERARESSSNAAVIEVVECPDDDDKKEG